LSSQKKYSISLWDLMSIIIPMLLLAPQIYTQVRFLWLIEHLQFFPFAFLAVGYFFYTEGKVGYAASIIRRVAAGAVVVIGWLFCIGAFVLDNHWLSHFAMVWLLFGWGVGKFGNLTIVRIAGILGLAVVTIPAPLGWDHYLVTSLQSLSASLCSALLDCVGVLHLKRGNVIEIVSKPLFVEEACSGVDSQYALMAVAGTLLLVGRSNLIVSLMTIVTVPIWAVLGNILRISSIVFGLEYFGIDLSEGFKHTLLGLATFSIAAWAHWSSVQAFNLLSHVIYPDVIESTSVAPQQEAALKRHDALALFRPRFSAHWLLLGFGLLAFGRVLEFHSRLNIPSVDAGIVDKFPDEFALPPNIDGWRREGFAAITRSRHNSEGEYSRCWTYSGGQESGSLSLDFPFRGWHALWECYINTGWSRSSTLRVDTDSSGNAIAWPFFEVRLTSTEMGDAVLFFSLFEATGRSYDYLGDFTHLRHRPLLERLSLQAIQGLRNELYSSSDPMTFQVQLLVQSRTSLDESQINAKRDIYLHLRKEVFAGCEEALREIRGEVK